ncbi:MAG: universal stress protein [Actinomycetota bacterium]|jgi:nucleotide-binding universal stress UspA family protein|nr:universal stress protein [Actinomycetota bacterium]
MNTQASTATRKVHRILVGIDGSDEAEEAARWGIDLASQMGAEVTLLGVSRSRKFLETEEDQTFSEEDARTAFDKMTAPLRRRAAQLSVGISSHTLSSEESPADIICKYAQDHGFDLVVVGSHGEEQIFHSGLGRSIERLLKNCRCPVLVTPEHSHRL